MRERARLQEDVAACASIAKELDDVRAFLELAEEADDDRTAQEAGQAAARLETVLEKLELQKVLCGPQDHVDALVSINAGAGGTDAQDWCEMLLRMYLRWCAGRGYKTEILDQLPGEEAGLKSATFSAGGAYAYGFLRAEVGVHRLVRISPFDAGGRRHTSFASVWVYPDIEDSLEVEIRDDDIELEFFRSSGPGGQHVNKTESAVRIRHLPTGIVVQCQNERSQHKNKSQAMRFLRARLYERKLQEQEEKLDAVRAQKRKIEFGSQIRSYVLAPYRLVTDHRTEMKVGAVDAVLDGDLDGFITAYHFQKE